MHAFGRLHRDDDGVAMVIAMMVVFVVVLLSIVIFDLSIHNVDQAAYDRKRVTSIAAAESGVDRAWNLVQYTAPEDLPCTESGSLGTAPGPATYDVTYTWYDAAGASMPCTGDGRPSQEDLPVAVLVTSVGRTNEGVPRTMQAHMTLSPSVGGFGAAIIAVNDTTFNNNFIIRGDETNNGDVYITSGNLNISNTPNIYGNVYVHDGFASMANNSRIFGDLWANELVRLDNASTVTGDAISSTQNIAGGSGTIGSDAVAGTAISSTLAVGGTKYPNSPQGPPPTHEFPLVCKDPIAGVCAAQTWPGYTLNTFTSCDTARSFLLAGTLTGDQLVWISTVCELRIQNLSNINFTGNLAIMTNGSIRMDNQNNWNGVSGKNLYFIVNYREGLDCSSGLYDVRTGNDSNFLNAAVLFYSPCTVQLDNQNDFSGQVLAATVKINNQFTMNATPVLIPGSGDVAGFEQSIVYIREVVN